MTDETKKPVSKKPESKKAETTKPASKAKPASSRATKPASKAEKPASKAEKPASKVGSTKPASTKSQKAAKANGVDVQETILEAPEPVAAVSLHYILRKDLINHFAIQA